MRLLQTVLIHFKSGISFVCETYKSHINAKYNIVNICRKCLVCEIKIFNQFRKLTGCEIFANTTMFKITDVYSNKIQNILNILVSIKQLCCKLTTNHDHLLLYPRPYTNTCITKVKHLGFPILCHPI